MTPREQRREQLIQARLRIDNGLIRLGVDPRTLPVPIKPIPGRDAREQALHMIQIDHLTHAQTATRLGLETGQIERLIAPRRGA